MRWSSVSESERASGASADDRTRNCGSETRGVTLARRSRGGRVLFTLHNTFECSLGLGGGGTSFVPQFTLPVLSGSPPFWFNPRLVLSALAIGLGCALLSPAGHCGEWRLSIIDNTPSAPCSRPPRANIYDASACNFVVGGEDTCGFPPRPHSARPTHTLNA